MGMSAGGSFAPTLGLQIGARHGDLLRRSLPGVMAATNIPQIWNNQSGRQRRVDNAAAYANYQHLLSAASQANFISMIARRCTRALPANKRSDEQQALALYADLANNNLLDSATFSALPRRHAACAHSASASTLPRAFSHTRTAGKTFSIKIRCSLANHQFFSDRNYTTLRFFERLLFRRGATHSFPTTPALLFPKSIGIIFTTGQRL